MSGMRFIAILLAWKIKHVSFKQRNKTDKFCAWGSVASRSREVILLWAGDSTSGALCPMLGSPIQERQGVIGDGPAEGCESGEVSGGKDEGSVCA